MVPLPPADSVQSSGRLQEMQNKPNFKGAFKRSHKKMQFIIVQQRSITRPNQ